MAVTFSKNCSGFNKLTSLTLQIDRYKKKLQGTESLKNNNFFINSAKILLYYYYNNDDQNVINMFSTIYQTVTISSFVLKL